MQPVAASASANEPREPSDHRHGTGSSAYRRFKAASYFSSINGVRAVCALIVVKEHVNWRLPLPAAGSPVEPGLSGGGAPA